MHSKKQELNFLFFCLCSFLLPLLLLVLGLENKVRPTTEYLVVMKIGLVKKGIIEICAREKKNLVMKSILAAGSFGEGMI